MKKDIKVLLTEKWWTDNKDKTLSDKAGLGKALKSFEDCYKLAAVAKGTERIKRFNAAREALGDVADAAAKTAKNAIKLLHGDTIHVLTKTMPAKIIEYERALLKLSDATKKEYLSLKPVEVLQDNSLRLEFMKFATKRNVLENPNFLLAASQKNVSVYNEFIRAGSPQEINITGKLRKQFDEAFAAGTLASAPWKDAVGVVVGLIQSNDMLSFGKYLLDME